MTSANGRPSGRVEQIVVKLVSRPFFWVVVITLAFGLPIVRSLQRELPEPLPELGRVPSFTLTDQRGGPFSSQELRGHAYIANFFFTSCPSICPPLMEKTKTIQGRLSAVGDRVRIVSFTVDPQNDTPAALQQYAEKLGANQRVWTFLTGKKESLRPLLTQGFMVPMGEKEKRPFMVEGEERSLFDIAHSGKLVLVDGRGEIRGFYSTEQKDVDRLMIDVGLLINSAFKKRGHNG